MPAGRSTGFASGIAASNPRASTKGRLRSTSAPAPVSIIRRAAIGPLPASTSARTIGRSSTSSKGTRVALAAGA